MESPIPPDPYAALGVSSSAQPNEIKAAYRKLVLRCHPDKITDEAQKQKAVDEFHKVQQAYEIVGDEEKRGRYDALVRLAELRRQKMEMSGSSSQGPRVDLRTSSYDTRTAAPPQASFATRGPPRPFATNERRPGHYSDEELPRASARKAPHEYNFVRRPTFDREREKDRDSDRAKRDEERRKAERRRDNEREADRSSKYASASRDEDFARLEELRRRRDNEEKDQSRRSPPRKDSGDDRTTRQYEEAQKYMASQRPSYTRSTSSRDVQYAYVRRSGAEPRERRSGREASPRESRRAPEIVDPSRPSTLKAQYSDPAGMANAIPRSRDKPEAHRSYTTQTDFDRRRDGAEPAPFPFSRSSTMPMPPSSSSSRKPAPSNLRTTDIPDSGYSSPATPEREFAPPPPGPPPSSSKTTQYHYPDTTSTSKISSSKDYRTIYRQPTSSNTSARRVSPPAKERTSTSATKTANMMANLASSRAVPVRSSTFTSYTEPANVRASPRSSRSPERISSRDDRDRGRRERYREEPPRGKLYGEVGAGRDPRSRTSYAPEDTASSRRYGRDDPMYSSGTIRDSRGSDYERAPPGLSRRGTAVY